MVSDPSPDEAEFEEQLRVFQTDVATVVRCYFAVVAMDHLASADPQLHRELNAAPEFWNLMKGATQTTLFIALGRIFDTDGDARFSLAKLISAARKDDGAVFAVGRLAERKRRCSPNADEWLREYLKDVYAPTSSDFRALRTIIGRYRRCFEAIYRPIRTRVYAHALTTGPEAAGLFADTRRNDLERLIRFLQRLGDGLWGLYWNGHNPLRRKRFPPVRSAQLLGGEARPRGASDQEVILRAVRTVMRQVKK